MFSPCSLFCQFKSFCARAKSFATTWTRMRVDQEPFSQGRLIATNTIFTSFPRLYVYFWLFYKKLLFLFLAVQNSSIGDLVCLSDQTNNQSLHKPTEWSHTLVTFGTFDQSDEETWPDQKRSTYLHTYISIREHPKGAIIGTCDIWDTDYNTDNWEPGFMTIFVTWQVIVTLDSIRNSWEWYLNHKY